jgi:acyl dehydratase
MAASASLVEYSGLEALAGKELGTSAWRRVDQEMIDAFAEATGDRNWIHVDVERASRESGGTIAHGFLILSLMPSLAGDILSIPDAGLILNYGVEKVRFTNSVRSGSNVCLHQSCARVVEHSGGKRLWLDCSVMIEGHEKPACVAQAILQVFPVSN